MVSPTAPYGRTRATLLPPRPVRRRPPQAVVDQVVGDGQDPGSSAGIDLDALLVATNMFDQGGVASLATMRQLCLKAAGDNAATVRTGIGRASPTRAAQEWGAEPAAQSFLAHIGHDEVSGSPEADFDDGGYPVNLRGASTAARWVRQRWARRCEHRALGVHHDRLDDCGGHGPNQRRNRELRRGRQGGAGRADTGVAASTWLSTGARRSWRLLPPFEAAALLWTHV
jgi:hypothetical protein